VVRVGSVAETASEVPDRRQELLQVAVAVTHFEVVANRREHVSPSITPKHQHVARAASTVNPKEIGDRVSIEPNDRSWSRTFGFVRRHLADAGLQAPSQIHGSPGPASPSS